LCTTVDAWSPEAQEYDLGRRCLKAILSEPDWIVRILTKNAAVSNDFDVIEKHKDRVLIGLSVTAPPEKQDIISCIEPNASPISERIAVMNEAARRGFRTYAMFCPLLSGISADSVTIGKLIQLAESWNAEEVFVEAVNARANGLALTQKALENAGFHREAVKIQAIRSRKVWNQYVFDLIKTVQKSVRHHSAIEKLRILQYQSSLTGESISMIKEDEAGVVWL
jgi:DNA repair photolyase